jgi:hypothetical protein
MLIVVEQGEWWQRQLGSSTHRTGHIVVERPRPREFHSWRHTVLVCSCRSLKCGER